MAVMSRSDYIKWIFQDYLYFLSKGNIDHLLRICRESGDEKYASLIMKLLCSDGDDLIRMMGIPGDRELIVLYADVFLWRQKNGSIQNGDINHKLMLACKCLKRHHRWLLDRYMVANGYEGIDVIPIEASEGIVTYADEISQYLDLQKMNYPISEDDFSYFITNLNVIGPIIKYHKRIDEILNYYNHISRNYKYDPRVKWIDPACYAMLTCDLDNNSDENWPAYQFLTIEGHKEFIGFVDAFLGIKLFGDKYTALLKATDKKIFGGYDFISKLALNSN